MPVPANKYELMAAIKTNYARLQADLADIPENLSRKKELEGHSKNTLMSVCDLIAYLIGWGDLVLKWTKQKDLGKQVYFPEKGYKWNELGQLAQKFYKDYKNETYSELLHKLDNIVKEILLVIDHKTNKQLYETDWYEGWSHGRLIQFNTSSPYDNASKRVRKWKKLKNVK